MILRRVISHFRKQEWTAIGLDFVIVVIGVFMGIQLGNWNQALGDRARESAYLDQIVGDLNADFRKMDLVTKAARDTMSVIKVVLERAEKGPPPKSFYLPGCVYQPCTGDVIFAAAETSIVDQPFAANDVLSNKREFAPVRNTYDALISTGDIGLLRDENLARRVQAYYANAIEAQNLDGAINDNFRNLVDTRHGLGIAVAGATLDDLISAVRTSPKFAAQLRSQFAYSGFQIRAMTNTRRLANELVAEIEETKK